MEGTLNRGASDFVPKETNYEDLVVLKLDKFIRERVLIADRERSIRGLYETAFAEETDRKGRALETLVAALFSSIDGFVEVERNIGLRMRKLTSPTGMRAGIRSAKRRHPISG